MIPPLPPPPRTVAERTHYQRTSTVAEVRVFMTELVLRHASLRPYRPKGAPKATEAGRPLLAWRLAATGPAPMRVYFNANIHAGEVEGKEAVQRLARELVEGEHPELRRAFECVFMPCYNADGTDALDPANRRHQPNPEVSGVGRRENARGLDLNRDLMKAETANTRWFLAMLQDFDPAVVFDLHTTNGSYHGFHLTYAPALALGADPALAALNRDLLVSVRGALAKDGLPAYDYGNFEPSSNPKRWETFDFRPRYLSNYPALQNRLAILSEAYVYRGFEQRVEDTHAFLLACLRELAARKTQVRDTLLRAKREWIEHPGPLPLSATMKEMERAAFDLVTPVKDAEGRVTGEASRTRLELPGFTGWEPKDLVDVPSGYLVDAAFADRVRPVLEAHGLRVLPGSDRPKAPAPLHFKESFRTLATQAFQGRFTLALRGEWTQETLIPMQARWTEGDLDAALYVPLDQPFGRAAFYLLDPRSPDGLVHWGFFHEVLLRNDGSWGEPPRFPILAAPRRGDATTVPPTSTPPPPFSRAE